MRAKLVVLSLSITLVATAVSHAAPRYKLDAGGRRVVEVTNLGGTEGCVPSRVSGKVVAREFDKRGTTLTGVTIEEKDGSRTFVNVGDLPTSEMSMVEIEWVNRGLQTLLKQGAGVALVAGACGAAGRVMVLEAVRPSR